MVNTADSKPDWDDFGLLLCPFSASLSVPFASCSQIPCFLLKLECPWHQTLHLSSSPISAFCAIFAHWYWSCTFSISGPVFRICLLLKQVWFWVGSCHPSLPSPFLSFVLDGSWALHGPEVLDTHCRGVWMMRSESDSCCMVSSFLWPPWTVTHQAFLCPWNSPGKKTGWWKGLVPYYRLLQDSAFWSSWGWLVQDFPYKSIWPSGSMKFSAYPVCVGAITQEGGSLWEPQALPWPLLWSQGGSQPGSLRLQPSGCSSPVLSVYLQPPESSLQLLSCPFSFFHPQLPHPCSMFFSHFWCDFIFYFFL